MGSMLPLDKREQAGLGVSSGSGYSGPAVTITGNFVCANTPSAALQVVLFKGNLTVDNNLLAEVTGNQISGNVDVSGNSNFAIVAGNKIGGNLRCSNNNPPPVDDNNPNTVSGHKLGQCVNR